MHRLPGHPIPLGHLHHRNPSLQNLHNGVIALPHTLSSTSISPGPPRDDKSPESQVANGTVTHL
jgi:hypothetical protein